MAQVGSFKYTLKGTKLIIECDLETEPSPSASGKTLVLGTTGGFQSVGAKVEDAPLSASITLTVPNPERLKK